MTHASTTTPPSVEAIARAKRRDILYAEVFNGRLPTVSELECGSPWRLGYIEDDVAAAAAVAACRSRLLLTLEMEPAHDARTAVSGGGVDVELVDECHEPTLPHMGVSPSPIVVLHLI